MEIAINYLCLMYIDHAGVWTIYRRYLGTEGDRNDRIADYLELDGLGKRPTWRREEDAVKLVNTFA